MTLYDDLGVSEDATAEELQRAYRARAREHHPDRTGQEDASAFRKAQEAYEVLSNAKSRRDYDQSLEKERKPSLRGKPSRVVEVVPPSRSRVYEVRRVPMSDRQGFEERFDRLARFYFGW